MNEDKEETEKPIKFSQALKFGFSELLKNVTAEDVETMKRNSAKMNESLKETEPWPTTMLTIPDTTTQEKIEVIEFLEDKNLGYHLGNAVQYISRAGIKDENKLEEDINKAIWYLRRFLEIRKDEPCRPNDMQVDMNYNKENICHRPVVSDKSKPI